VAHYLVALTVVATGLLAAASAGCGSGGQRAAGEAEHFVFELDRSPLYQEPKRMGAGKLDLREENGGCHEHSTLDSSPGHCVMDADLSVGEGRIARYERSESCPRTGGEVLFEASGADRAGGPFAAPWTWVGRTGITVSRESGEAFASALVEGAILLGGQGFGISLCGLSDLVRMDLPAEGIEGTAINARYGRTQRFRYEPRGFSMVRLDDAVVKANRSFFWTSAEGHTLYSIDGKLLGADGLAPLLTVRGDGVVLPLEAPERPPEGVLEIEALLERPDAVLRGTVARPSDEPARGAVLLVAGSGPVDRDGNVPIFKSWVLRSLAWRLARDGFEVVRYDKRGVAKSAFRGDKHNVRLEDFASDAKGWAEWLLSRWGDGRVFVLGHSEGGYIAPMVAQDLPSLGGIVLLAGPVHRLDHVSESQLEAIMTAQGAKPGEIAETRAQLHVQNRLLLEDRQRGRSIDPTLDIPVDAGADWFRSHVHHDPAAVFENLRVPSLAIYGDQDLQVLATEEVPAMQALLDERAGNGQRDATIAVLPGVDHLMMTVRGPAGLGIYRDPDRRIAPLVVDTVEAWIADRTPETEP
jgi:uncharacterized protein